ncbi:hypothetical protein EAO75_30605 [Streptomyces sp. uw30]|uniref:hypothetical protein n=1 Tax=Streptomyces sp. uw30 TaxID=1828179 RepID=UPI0011CE62ED|nr:hypothetical protein [Streptomyces sp. uw30]TXS43100.1 hypothetical protein EAO75_30605 [Streptomyces sp. uw30]
MRYLTVTGTLSDPDTLHLSPGFRIDRLPDPPPALGEDALDALVVHSLDAENRIVGREAVATAPLCAFGSGLPAPRFAAGVIEVAEGTRALRFLFQGRQVHHFTAPQGEPAVRLRWEPQGAGEQTGVRLITWEGRHPDRTALSYMALYSTDGRDWIPLCLPQPEPGTAADFDALPGGSRCRIRVMATDGLHTALADSPHFPVPRKGLEPAILYPDDDSRLPANEPHTLVGQAVSPEDPGAFASDLRWTSSRDGTLGTGRTLDVTLSPGEHVLTLTTADGARETFVTVTLEPGVCGGTAREDGEPGHRS